MAIIKNLIELLRNKQIQGHNQRPGSVVFLLKHLGFIILLLMCFILPVKLTRAQLIPDIITESPHLSDFPYLAIIFKIRDVNGQPVQQVNKDQITIYEDDIAVTLQDVTVNRGGVHFILAINADRQLGLRDINGISNYEYLMSAIDNWIKDLNPPVQDLWSFMVNQGKSITSLDNSDTWYGIVRSYQPDMRNTVGNLTSLSTSIDLAKTYSKSIPLDQVLLYITPMPSAEDLEDLIDLRQGAIASGLHINIWMIGNENDLNTNRGQALYDLAKSTGGSFFLFPGHGTIPDPQNYLDPFGFYFKATYFSGINTSGKHSVAIGLKNETQDLRSESQEFNITVVPPSPVFLSPPIEIIRKISDQDAYSGNSPVDIRTLKVMIEFNDQHPRNLKLLQLYQDGVLVAEQTTPPFGSLSWDVSGITETSMVNLQIKLEDEIGLSGSSTILPVNVVVEKLNSGSDQKVAALNTFKFISLSLIASIVTGTIIYFFIRGYRVRKHRKVNTSPGKIPYGHPTSQKNDQSTSAMLTWLDKDNHPVDIKPIVIQHTSQVVGRDSDNCSIVIEDRSVDMVHAKIEYDPKQGYRLADLGSIAGTWVNYAPVSHFGVIIENLDLIHFGRVAFRFTISYTSGQGLDRSRLTKEFDAKS